MAEVKQIKEENFQKEVLETDLPVLVDFWAEWCNPCLKMKPLIEEISQEFKGKIKVCELNVDQNPGKAATYGIRSIPTIFFFKNGEVAGQVVGVVGKKELLKHVVKLIG
jgi:thioredoxin 1